MELKSLEFRHRQTTCKRRVEKVAQLLPCHGIENECLKFLEGASVVEL